MKPFADKKAIRKQRKLERVQRRKARKGENNRNNYHQRRDRNAPSCEQCGGQMSWCSCCEMYSRNCCVDYGTCWCS